MPPFSILVVAEEKELRQFMAVVSEAKKFVGPARVASASRADEAVSALSTLGHCDVALLNYRFTAAGKVEFSDALRKVLKDKHPDTPVICWGSTSKGGKQGENYHYALEDSEDPATLAEMLVRAKGGELSAEYTGKGRKSVDEKRKSLDASASGRRTSTDAAKPLPSGPSMRRKSMDSNNGAAPVMASGPSMRMAASPSMRASPMEDPMGMGMGMAMGMGASSMNRLGSMNGPAMGDSLVMGPAGGSMTNGGGNLVMGSLGTMGSMTRMGSLRAGGMDDPMMAGALPPVMGPLGGSMTGGTGSMTMGGMNAGLSSMNMGMGSMNAGMGSGMMMGSMGSGMVGSPMQTMPPMAQPLAMAAPAGSTGGGIANVDVNTLMTSPPASGNGELIRMLAEEVVRLRKALDEKRRRSSTSGMMGGLTAAPNTLPMASNGVLGTNSMNSMMVPAANGGMIMGGGMNNMMGGMGNAPTGMGMGGMNGMGMMGGMGGMVRC